MNMPVANESENLIINTPVPDSAVSLESILCTDELQRRPSRPPDYEQENRALVALAQALADSPRTILQTLAETILEVFQAHSAGISLLTTHDGGQRFYWPAIAGLWKQHVGGGTPRNFGPCGDVLDRNVPLMFRHFERRYTYFQPVKPLVEECLLVPFQVQGKAVGTIWAIAHDDSLKFDAEDLRQLESFGRFASAAYEVAATLETVGQLAAIVELSDDAIISKDLNGIIQTWNGGAERLFGYTAQEAIGQPAIMLLPADRLDEDSHIMDRVRGGKRIDHYETLRLCKDGTPRDVSLSISPVVDARGQIVGASKIVRDITGRKQAEEAVHRRTAQYETLLNEAPLGVYLVDGDFRIRQVNPTARTAFGEIPELAGRDFDEVMHILWPQAYADEMVERFRHTLETGEAYVVSEQIEERLDRGVREFYEWQINRILLPEGRYGVVCYFRDISRQVLARAAITASEERLRFMAESVPQKIFTAKPNGEIDYFNPQWTEFTGLAFEQVKDWGWTQFVHPDDLDENIRHWEHSIDTGKPFRFEHRFRRTDGEYRWHLSRAHAMRDVAGKVLLWLGSNTDIDDLKRAEKEREQLLIREHEARQQAETANRVKDEFLATISHELRTPLNAIMGWTAILARGKQDEESIARGLATIARNAKLQNQLISDLLDVSRIISGQLRFETGAVDLMLVINTAADSIRPAAEEKGIELRCVLDPLAGMVSGDAARLQQIFSNLFTNAVKYTSKNGRVDVRLQREGTSVVINVSDTGEGISPEFLPHIFDRFRQAEGSITRQHGGLGLGLAIVRHLVEAHGGTVQASSQGTGQGATFTVTFPLIAISRVDHAEHANAEKGTLDQSSSALILEGLRVLVVDDQRDARELLTIALKQSGSEVRASATASEALDIMDQWRPDVLVSDIGMPGEDGYELMRRVRAREPERGGLVPALAVTGYASPEDATRARAVGYQLHMAKPVAPGQLVAKVASLAMNARTSEPMHLSTVFAGPPAS